MKRKCRRCKIIHEGIGKGRVLCARCNTHCGRCDKELTAENTTKGKGNHKNICKFCHAEVQKTDKSRDARLVRTYGITFNEYQKIFQVQNGVCYICEKPGRNKALAVDHKHVLRDKKQNPRNTRTRVRGLLCWNCNRAIAKFNDDPVRLRRAAIYLENWPAKDILKEAQ